MMLYDMVNKFDFGDVECGNFVRELHCSPKGIQRREKDGVYGLGILSSSQPFNSTVGLRYCIYIHASYEHIRWPKINCTKYKH